MNTERPPLDQSVQEDVMTLESPDATLYLNQWLRQQMAGQEPPPPAVVAEIRPPRADDAAVAAVAALLGGQPATAREQLEQLYQALDTLYRQTPIPEADRKRQFIARSGLVISPDHCLTTIRDLHRLKVFVRGIDRALARRRQGAEQRPVRILYPACGPLAPLLLPLLCYYRRTGGWTPEQLQVTLIDIQPGAVACLQAVAGHLGVEAYLEAILCMDAFDYLGDRPFDLLVLEAMQHGFSREGQLGLAHQLLPQLAVDGELIPQRIEVTAELAVGQYEFVERWRNARPGEEASLPLPERRIPLGTIANLDLDSLRALAPTELGGVMLVPFNQLTIPPMGPEGSAQLLLICTRVWSYGEEVLDQYQSGITHPLPDTQVCINFEPSDPRPGDLLLKSGDRIRFFYRLYGLPGFMATQGESP